MWFDSGSMSFAQVHYPFENAEWFEHHFPGDFIVEYIGQTRGWFYTLHVLATALFDRPGLLVVRQPRHRAGQRRPEDEQVAEELPRRLARSSTATAPTRCAGSSCRSGILRGSNLVVTEEGIREGVRQVLIPLWNSWSFFSLYANAFDGGKGYTRPVVDGLDRPARPLPARQAARHGRDRAGARWTPTTSRAPASRCASSSTRMTNWYIRRSRERFWDTAAGDGAVARAAFDTLYTALEVLTRVAAPLLPLVTEEIWRGLTGGRSVHLEDWPDAARPPGRRRARRRDGPGAGGVLHRLVAAQGREAAGAPAAAAADRRHQRPRGAAAVRRHRRRRAQRQGGHRARRRRGARVRLRHQPAPRRQRPRRRPAPGSRRADRDQGQQDRRLVGGRRRHGHLGRPRARRGRVRRRDGGRRRAGRLAHHRDAARRRVRRARHRRHAPSSRSRVRPATSCGRCSRPGATPASTSPTASRSRSPAPSSSTARCSATASW